MLRRSLQSELKSIISDFKKLLEASEEKSFLSEKSITTAPKKKVTPVAPIVAAPPPPPPPAPPSEPPIAIEKPKKVNHEDMSDWKKKFATLFPGIPVRDQPPADFRARQMKKRHVVPEVPLLVSGEFRSHATFLRNLSIAIDRSHRPSRLIDVAEIEKQNGWEAFLASPHIKLIICPDRLLFNTPNLMTHYKEVPQKQEKTLGDKPLLLLPDISIYMKDPSLKRSLWTCICRALAT